MYTCVYKIAGPCKMLVVLKLIPLGACLRQFKTILYKF